MSLSAITAVNVQVPSSANAPIIADFAEHAIRVAHLMRRDAGRLREQEWATPGVYTLLSDDGTHQVYIGKSTNLRSRLQHHKHKNAQVPGWSRAVLVKRDTTHGFTSADIGYLEGRLSAQFEVFPGITVVKGKTDGDSTLPRHMQMSLDALLPSVLAAARLAGIDVFWEDDVEPEPIGIKRTAIRGTVTSLIAEGLLNVGAELHCARGGALGFGTVAADGQIVVQGVGYKAPSLAAAISLGATSSTGFGGWDMWHVGSLSGPSLSDLRGQLAGR
ncbi:excinuclease ABC subunit C [Microbacterium testaceum]|uniref:restriction system modified-DNA reader domain-containing protein n=1 Tax=Microbacterium testaceum TaxID=2033 RepID=UPI0025B154A2|nr:excinuclease ABC subunit C [Microbacterium testaceum]WJS89740.1 excinuclease ABC subunit C [Microbacterium testaceum]